MKIFSRVLVVDDDVDDREIFAEAVAEVDPSIVCITAKDGEDAIKLLCNSDELLPEIVFLDLNMPRMDGRQMIIELKKFPKLENIPIIIYSTSSSKRDMDETKALGATHFMPKPSEFSELRKILAAILLGK